MIQKKEPAYASSFYAPPESRTQILRTGILRAIHYTKDPYDSISITKKDSKEK